MRRYLIKEIIRSDIDADTVFEFGCGRGETLVILKSLGYHVRGIEINPMEVQYTTKYHLGVDVGDEEYLLNYPDNSVDITFTVGVLDHIREDFDFTIRQFKRITKKTIFCLETNDVPSEYYYPHNYESFGFVKVRDFMATGTGDGCMYTLWRLDC